MVNSGLLDKEKLIEALTGTISYPPPGSQITKIEIGQDADGNVKTMKYFDKNNKLIFTLTYSNAGSVASSYTITRT